MVPRKYLFGLVCSVLVLSLLACGLPNIFGGGSDPTATPAPVSVATSAPAEATVAAPTQATEAATPTAAAAAATDTPAPAATAEGETVELPALSTSLDDVRSYSAVMEITYRTREQAPEEANSMRIIEESDRDAKAHRLVMDGTGEDGTPFAMEVITIGTDSWMSFGEGWMHTKSDDTEDVSAMAGQFLSEGDSLLQAAKNPVLVEKGVTVNGIVTDHYSFTEVDASELEGMTNVNGEVWLAQNGNFPVKMVMHAEGEVMGNEDEEQILDMTWELLSLNQPVNIAPPEGMALEDMLPVMEGAEQSSSYFVTGDMAFYDIAATMEEVVAWYDETLTAQGWEQTSVDISEDITTAAYARDDETLDLFLSKGDAEGTTSVMLTKGTS